MNRLLYDILLVGGGFAGGLITAFVKDFGKGWINEHFKKREEIRKDVEKFMGKVTDIVAIATPAGYTNRPNNADKRRMQRAAFQLERLGKGKLAYGIRSYVKKWSEVYEISKGPSFKNGKLPIKEDEKRRLTLIKELDDLTDSILKG